MKNQPAVAPARAFLLLLSLFTTLFLSAQTDSLPNTIGVSYEQTHFNNPLSKDWRVTSLEYKRKTAFGALLGRVNYASRFGQSGMQLEGEAYPVINKKVYGFVNLAYAASVPVFARWRTGTTIYYSVAKSWEAEGGFRYLYFDRSIWMGTAGISKYAGAWLLNARTFFSINTPLRNRSFFLKAQRYFQNEKDYVWLQAGSGVSPDEARNVLLNTEGLMLSKRLSAGGCFSLTDRLQVLAGAGYAIDENPGKTTGTQVTLTAGAAFRW